MNKGQKIGSGVVVVLAIALAILAVVYFRADRNSTSNTVSAKPFAVEKVELSPNKIPQGFPDNLPVEQGATVMQNYEATTTDGRLQSTRIISSTKSVSQSVKVYTDFFSSLGWVEVSTTSEADSQKVLFRNNDDVLMVVVKANSQSKGTVIELTLTQVKN